MRRLSTGILLLASLPLVLIYLWLILSSLSERVAYGVIPTGFTLRNWRFLWEAVSVAGNTFPSIWQITFNTLVLALGLVVVEVLFSTMAAYALARFSFTGRERLLQSTILLHAFPSGALLIAFYYVLRLFGLLDTLAGVLLLKVAVDLPMNIWVMKGFFDTVPWNLEWAALIDGGTRFTAWRRILLPLVRPGIAAVATLSFLSGWSEFLFAHTFIFDKRFLTLSSFLKALTGDMQGVDYGLLTAVGTFQMLPILLFFALTQKTLMKAPLGTTKG